MQLPMVINQWVTIACLAVGPALSAVTGLSVPPIPKRPDFKPPVDAAPWPQPGKGKSADQLVKVRASADVEKIKPGETFRLAFIFDIEPQWHIYWQNPGASGGPTEIKIDAPPGFAVGKTLFPRPLVIQGQEGLTYGYQNQTVLFVEVDAPVEFASSQAIFNAQINWLVCKEVCLMGQATRMINLPMGSGGLSAPGGAKVDSALVDHKKRLPQPLKSLTGSTTTFDGGSLTIEIPAQGRTTAQFFPLDMPGVTYGRETATVQGQTLRLIVPVTVDPNNAQGQPPAIRGVIGLGDAQTDPCYDLEIALPAT